MIVKEHESVTSDDYSFSLNAEGINIIEKHGSYNAYLVSTNEKLIKAEKANKFDILRKNLTLIFSISFGLSTAILSWMSFNLNNKVQEKNDIILNKNDTILELSYSLDSSQKEIFRLKSVIEKNIQK